MQNDSLVTDYVQRARWRLAAVGTLAGHGAWADVVREYQEVVEIALKALLRASRIDVPRIHDVSAVLDQNADRLPPPAREHLDELCAISRSLRRDLELSFYGSEDLTPSQFYKERDATTALEQATRVVDVVTAAVEGG